MAQRYDFSRTFSGDGESEFLYARGILTVTIPGLVKTKTGKLATPLLRIDEEGNMQNYFYKDGEPLPLYDFTGDGKEKILKQPAMVGKTKEKNILLWVQENGEDKFFILEAWESTAKRLHMFYKKGQEICVLAHKVVTKGTASTPRTVWCIEDICKVEDDFAAQLKKSEKENKNKSETISGFREVEDLSELPFAD